MESENVWWLQQRSLRESKLKSFVESQFLRALYSRRDLLLRHLLYRLMKAKRRIASPPSSAHVASTNSLETRRDVLGAYSKYYVVVVQYTARFNAEAVKNFFYSLNEEKIPKTRFNLRLAPEETSIKLIGFEHNAVTCIGMKTDIPTHACQAFDRHYSRLLCPDCQRGPEGFNGQWVILDEAITKLRPDFF